MVVADLKKIQFQNNKNEIQLAMFMPSMERAVYCFHVELFIGRIDEEWWEIFQARIVNVNWVEQQLKEKKSLFLDNLIMVDLEEYEDLEVSLKELVGQMYDRTWEGLLKKLRKSFLWEKESEYVSSKF